MYSDIDKIIDKLHFKSLSHFKYNEYKFDKYFYDIDYDRILLLNKFGRIKIIKPYGDKQNRITLYDVDGKPKICIYSSLINYIQSNY